MVFGNCELPRGFVLNFRFAEDFGEMSILKIVSDMFGYFCCVCVASV